MDQPLPDNELRDLLSNPKRSGSHYICDCPYCGKSNHFYINRGINKKGIIHGFDCKKCQEQGSIIKLLTFLGKLFLVGEYKSYDVKKIHSTIGLKSITEEEEVIVESKKRPLPVGFKRIYEDDYLNGRGLSEMDYLKYRIGKTKLINFLKEYIIFSVDEGGVSRGYIGRYTGKDKNEIRYRNSKYTNFGELVFGLDEITEETETLIIVEGLFDKISLDNILHLNNSPKTKSGATFGKKISLTQIAKIKAKGIKNIILIYDYDAILEMKKYGLILRANFENVLIGFTMNKDINDSEEEEVLSIFDRLKDVQHFVKKTVRLI